MMGAVEIASIDFGHINGDQTAELGEKTIERRRALIHKEGT
jgi:hypothetical protein